ncbi:DUF7344 domain-containing protein [Halomicrobium urmianum]|uniref:DUF7344 domain-containing protein n=1 Tax=Halomicrobium urmianum TaxID=1586233 RepID=UPI001CDA3B6F|nr:hypothetical protein [Halomicrobium urmianum]
MSEAVHHAEATGTITEETNSSTESESESETESETEIESDAETEAETELTRDDIFHLLQCRRRRLVLKYLKEYDGDGPARMSDIAEHIAALEHDTTIDALRSQQRQRVYIALYQSHLTTMDEAGVIEYNQDRGYVEKTDIAERFDPYLASEPSLLGNEEADDEEADDDVHESVEIDATADVDTSWHKRYLYAAGGSLVLASALASDFVSATLPAQVGGGVLISVLFMMLAVSHWLTESSSKDFEWSTPDVDDYSE